MASTMLDVNERAGALLSSIDVNDAPLALSANESPIFRIQGGRLVTIASSPVFTPTFGRYCAMMRRPDRKRDPRFATALLRRANLAALNAEIRAWVLTFSDIEALQAQVSEAGLAMGELRSVQDFAAADWAQTWGAVVDVDDRAGGTLRMPEAPWRFGDTPPPAPGVPRILGESNEQVLTDLGYSQEDIQRLTRAGVLKQASVPGTS